MAVLLDISPKLAPVQQLIQTHLGAVDAVFNDAIGSDLAPVSQLCKHVEQYRGKMLRPALVGLCGLVCDPTRTTLAHEHAIVGAVCEMVHMATLVHDDVLDDADTRRKGATINALRGNESAVILGDYIYSAAYRLCATLNDPEPSRHIARTGMVLCEGELLQLHNRENLAIDEATYTTIIERKTASLIAVACRLGAHVSNASVEQCDAMHRVGTLLGCAFQIQDDLLDLSGDESAVGKPLRKDATLGKLTLPIIHHLRVASDAVRARSLAALRETESGTPGNPNAFDRLLDGLGETDSLAYALTTATTAVENAKAILREHTQDAPPRDYLLELADSIITRSR